MNLSPVAFLTQLLTQVQQRVVPRGCFCNCTDCRQCFSCADIDFGCIRFRAGTIAAFSVFLMICLVGASFIVNVLHSKYN